MALKFDCRTINDGNRCEYLYERDVHKIKVPGFYICTILNCVILPDLDTSNKVTEKVDSACPIYGCPKMQIYRLSKQCMDVEFSIEPGGIKKFWNENI